MVDASATSKRPLASGNHRPGFTVLELIVALTLGLVLLSAIWTMFRLFLRHQEIETAQVARTQLVSSLHHLLSRDLLTVIPEGREGPQGPTTPPVSSIPTSQFEPANPLLLFPGSVAELPLPGMLPQEPPVEGGNYTLPTSSLQGSRQRLELVIFSGPDDLPESPEDSSRSQPGPSETDSAAPRLPSKVIVYEFVGLAADLSSSGTSSLYSNELTDPDEDPVEAAMAAVGLWRRESSGSSPSARPVPETDSRSGAPSSAANQTSGSALPSFSAPSGTGTSTAADNSTIEEFAPEVVDLRFEYFDGRKWSANWDSQRQKRLPVLVRVQLSIETRPATRTRKLKERMETGPGGETDPLLDSQTSDDSMLDAAEQGARPTSLPRGSERTDSPWDYEFLIFVTPPPATSPPPGEGGRLPNGEPSLRSPESPSSRDLLRPRSGGLKQ